MKKLSAIIIMGAIALGGMSVTTPVFAKEKAAETREKVVVGAPPEGKGQVVFFRTSGMGFALGCGVNENNARISALGVGKYFVHPADPGTHSYMAKSESKDVLTLEVEPGETYYVRCTIKMGIMVGRPNLAPSTAQDFEEYSEKLKYVDADDIGPNS